MEESPIHKINWIILALVGIMLVSGCSWNRPKAESDKNSPIKINQMQEKQITNEQRLQQQYDATTKRSRPLVKGIYVSAYVTQGKKLEKLLAMMEANHLNTMVIDVKSDTGQIMYDSSVKLVNEIGADANPVIKDSIQLMKHLKDKGIYLIARIVVFKDSFLTRHRQEYALVKKEGGLWKDRKGARWLNPYKNETWRYNLDIAKEAVMQGFDEIQFDYVRFPENGKRVDSEVDFGVTNGRSKADTIAGFIAYAKKELGPHTNVSADVFGLTTFTTQDGGIGQDWSKLSPSLDVISPMIYPSHYNKGFYGIRNPNEQPYALIKQALGDAIKSNARLSNEGKKGAVIRPWLQDFTAYWIKPHREYTAADVREQIKAAHEMGIDEFLLWNSQCRYSFK
ncbi:putative glycoside hydrolase [Paenibacillus sp. KN14-4R]|uniref:putative glycoside hydrolase n=1 Tax=Paenibacillus sp. KN14-4R TaxID=3445773 RepID=UPI003F9FD915